MLSWRTSSPSSSVSRWRTRRSSRRRGARRGECAAPTRRAWQRAQVRQQAAERAPPHGRPVQGATRREGEGASRAAGAESRPSHSSHRGLTPGSDPVTRAAPQGLLRPSPVVSQYHAQIQKLKSAVSSQNAQHPAAEREAQLHSRRLLRVRSVLGAFLRSKQARSRRTRRPTSRRRSPTTC